MDVKDYTQRLNSAKDRFRDVENELRTTYEKNTEGLKENYNNRLEKRSSIYDRDKAKLEEQNAINNEHYSTKAQEEISKRQSELKNELAAKTEEFSKDRDSQKKNFDRKLSSIKDSFDRSTVEKDKYHSEAQRMLNERYNNASSNLEKTFQNQVSNLSDKADKTVLAQKEFNNDQQKKLSENFQEEVDKLRTTGRENKFKEVSRLQNDNQNLRNSFAQETASADEQRDARINDIIKNKNKESFENQKNFNELQDSMRNRNLSDQEKIKETHIAEKKDTEKKFSDELKNVRRLANQKIQNGTEVESLKEENKQLKFSHNNRTKAMALEHMKELEFAKLKEEKIDEKNRDNIRDLKLANVELNERNTKESTEDLRNVREKLGSTNSDIIDRYKQEIATIKKQDDTTLTDQRARAKLNSNRERIEFGKTVNAINEKNIDTVANLKNEFAKDKTNFIEKSKREFSEEKTQIREEFKKEMELREAVNDKRIASLEETATKIIDNYEMRLEQLARNKNKEIDTLRTTEEERKLKEDQAVKLAREDEQKNHASEIQNIRDKYERTIARDRILGDQQATKIVQRYEDQMERERFDHQRELQSKLTEAQSQFERLYKSSELEKDTMRKQYEARIDMLKLAQSERENSKKA